MILRTLLAFGLLASLAGCTASSADPDVASGESDLSLSRRTFRVQPQGEGCSFPYDVLYVKRGGKVTFDNGTWYEPSEEVTGDDNLYFLIEWPNALGEDGAARFDVTTGTKETLTVPYLDDELFGGGSSLDFDVLCTPLSSGKDVTTTTRQATVRIFR